MTKHRLYRLGIFFLLSLTFCFLLNVLPISQLSIKAQTSLGENDRASSSQSLDESDNSRNASDPVLAQGISKYKAGQYSEAIALWEQILRNPENTDIATIHANLGAAYRQVGKLNKAIEHWEEAIKSYRVRKEIESRSLLAGALADQSQAYNAIGQFRQALSRSNEAVEIAQKIQARKTEAFAQGILGNAYSIAGDYEQALNAYAISLKLATALNNPKYITTALNNQVNVLNIRSKRYLNQSEFAQREGDTEEQKRLSKLAEQDRSNAFGAATRALKESRATDDTAEVKALLNLVRLSPSMKQDYLKQAIAILEKLPDSRSKIYALIQASKVRKDQGAKGKSSASAEYEIRNLESAITVARHISDRRSESFALGDLGHVYELEGQRYKALDLTRQAQAAAQQVNARDSLYRWQWQEGRIYKALGFLDEAVSSYKQASATLQSVRSDLVTANRELQFDMRDEVEPVYRELMSLLLENSESNPGNINEALEVLKVLKLSELQSFFGDDCLEVQGRFSSENIVNSKKEAVVTSVILNEKTYIILRLPDGTFHTYPVFMTSEQLQSKIEHFRLSLENASDNDYLVESQELYDLLIRPMEGRIAKARPSTLVFVNDGVLQNIPMAVLHDGDRFLVEKYPIAARLSNDLITADQREQKRPALVFGLTAEIPPLAPLPYVKSEIEAVHSVLGGSRYLNKDFTYKRLQDKIQKDYPIVHIATHGKFGGTYTNTFLQAFDGRISLGQLEKVIRSKKEPIELLTLSACQTAAGDERSTLGFAGLAVRNGVRNVLASLWYINDAKTVLLIKDFYAQQSQPNITKAEALRKAQLKLLTDPILKHPAYWSPFILIN